MAEGLAEHFELDLLQTRTETGLCITEKAGPPLSGSPYAHQNKCQNNLRSLTPITQLFHFFKKIISKTY